MSQEIMQQLRAPFAFEDIEAVVQVTNGDKTKGLAVFRLNAHAVQERLDAVVGPFNWRNEYISPQDNSRICGLSLYNSERGEWVTKYGGEDANGGMANSFLLAAELWSIGRYLHHINCAWVDVEQRDDGYSVKDSQQSVLKSAYDMQIKSLSAEKT